MDRHIVIAGQGRSGSTLFYTMLRATLQGFHLPDREVKALDLLDRPGNVCTKRPFDILDIARIAAGFKGRKRLDLVVTLRDPRDILTSHHARVPGDYFVDADLGYYVPEGQPPERTAPGILPLHNAIVEALSGGHFPQGVFVLKYEHLVRDPDRIQALLAEGLGLDFHGAFAGAGGTAVPAGLRDPLNGVRGVETSRLAKWRRPEHRARILDQFTRFPQLHQVVETLGYEADRGWFDALLAEGPVPAGAR